jgi:DNA-binding NtrC family response regulator
MEKRRHNPLVDRYVTTDLPLTDILADAPQPRQPVAQALLLIEECLNGNRLARDVLRIAENVDIKHCDPEMLMLMLCSWAELSSRLGRINESETLLHRIRALTSPALHPAILARTLVLEAFMADCSGNLTNRENKLRAALETIPATSPRRKFIIWEICLLLARQGRGNEERNWLNEMMWQCNERLPPSAVQLVQFVNAIETGSLKEAADLMPRIAASSPHLLFKEAASIPYRGYQALLQLMHGIPDSTPEPTGGMPAWITITSHLLERQPDAALALAREDATRNLHALTGSGFEAFSLVRAELAARHPEGALRVLNLRNSKGNVHYLDDMFRARAEYLRANRRAAAECFNKALQAVDKYDAKGRLDFELRMACEIDYGDIVSLTQDAARREAKQSARRAAELSAVTQTEQAQNNAATTPEIIIGRSPAYQQLCEVIARFAPLDAPVLITGETGTGKELVARALHSASPRANEQFTALNCGSITETLLESELFGYTRGAFTGAVRDHKGLFESTGKGTLFLDEIGNISPRLQQALLRVLETSEIRPVGSSATRKVSCRIIAATNAGLEELAQHGLFRSDLLYRLQRLGIHITPLRERREDILPITRHFIDIGRPIGTHAKLSNELIEALRSYQWPGNVRELRNVIERMRLLHSDKLSYNDNDLEIKFHAVNIGEKPFAATVAQHIPPPAGAQPANQPAIATPLQPDAPAPAVTMADVLQQGNSPMRRLEKLKALFTEHRKLTRNEVINVLHVSPNTATKDLKCLCEQHFIERIEPSASSRSYYFQLVEKCPEIAHSTND